MTKKMRYIVAYIAGHEEQGVSSDWVSCQDMDQAVDVSRKIQRQYGFATISIGEILERHDTGSENTLL